MSQALNRLHAYIQLLVGLPPLRALAEWLRAPHEPLGENEAIGRNRGLSGEAERGAQGVRKDAR
jgi:hypothetical protein